MKKKETTRERRKKLWKMMSRGVDSKTAAEVLGVDRATVIYDQVAMRMASHYAKKSWKAGDRIRLTYDGWGKMPAGAFGTVLKVFDRGPGLADYGVLWDTGVRDCINEDLAERLSPLEQIASVI